MRTTLDIDDPILREIKQLQKAEGKSLGRIVSDLLAQSLAAQKPKSKAQFDWFSRPMSALINLDDKDALYASLDEK